MRSGPRNSGRNILAPDEFTELLGIVRPIKPTIGFAQALWREGVTPIRSGERYAEVCRDCGERVLIEWEAGGQTLHVYWRPGKWRSTCGSAGSGTIPQAWRLSTTVICNRASEQGLFSAAVIGVACLFLLHAGNLHARGLPEFGRVQVSRVGWTDGSKRTIENKTGIKNDDRNSRDSYRQKGPRSDTPSV